MPNQRHRITLAIHALCVLFVFLTHSPARADWINLTGAETSPNIAEITVLDDRVNVRLEVYVGDIETFRDLVPDNMLKDGGKDRPPLEERVLQFSRQGLKVLGPEGTPLPARLVVVEPRMRVDRKSPFAGFINPQTRQPVPEPPADKRVLYVEIEYPFEGKPETLTFSPPQDENGNAKVGIGFIAYHKAVPIIDFRYFGADATVRLDWHDPWYSKFTTSTLKRHHQSAMMSFLYMEPREVRHEMLIRLRDLEDWTDLGLGDARTFGKQDRAGIIRKAIDFLAERNPLTSDGTRLAPATSRAEFLKVSLTGLQVIEDDQPLDRSTAIIGVILSHHVKHLPEAVTLNWELFNQRITRIPATAIDPAGPLKTFIDATDPTLEWKNFVLNYKDPMVEPVKLDGRRTIGVPLLSLALVIGALAAAGLVAYPFIFSRPIWGTTAALCLLAAVLALRVGVVDVPSLLPGVPDEETSGRIVTGVLNNVNTAFLERDPAELKNALSIVVDDDVLPEVKAELGRALAIKVAGGGIAQIAAIENLSLKEINRLQHRAGFSSVAEWTARATAGHWGHPHRRTIRFRALMEVANIDGAWKLVGLTVVDARQQQS